ncbi:hypothetical protein KSP40_PGU015516 [Platanthera guangdongensis]|uniref:Uncharacterized protein n=1 Tax=Platanthera guangdongensis TaxID=2320717 RepID=A0ABR2LM20_9ASPA
MAFLSDHATARRLIDHNPTSLGAVMVVEALGMSAQASLMISPSPPFLLLPLFFFLLPPPLPPFFLTHTRVEPPPPHPPPHTHPTTPTHTQ